MIATRAAASMDIGPLDLRVLRIVVQARAAGVRSMAEWDAYESAEWFRAHLAGLSLTALSPDEARGVAACIVRVGAVVARLGKFLPTFHEGHRELK